MHSSVAKVRMRLSVEISDFLYLFAFGARFLCLQAFYSKVNKDQAIQLLSRSCAAKLLATKHELVCGK